MADIQLVLVEDDEQKRLDLRMALRSQDGIEVASEATNGETGLVLLESIDVDVAVVDASLPDMEIADFIRKMRLVQADSYVTQSKILVLVTSTAPSSLPLLLEAGAESYCLKQAPIQQLADAIRRTFAGENYCDPAIAPCDPRPGRLGGKAGWEVPQNWCI